mmetsp:Transcript_6203/g.17507  ORF Transcript_6203/g.17507 Transcript_6203/m.17507 type:complete len:225 (-) Transcript_6203:47-721(-)
MMSYIPSGFRSSRSRTEQRTASRTKAGSKRCARSKRAPAAISSASTSWWRNGFPCRTMRGQQNSRPQCAHTVSRVGWRATRVGFAAQSSTIPTCDPGRGQMQPPVRRKKSTSSRNLCLLRYSRYPGSATSSPGPGAFAVTIRASLSRLASVTSVAPGSAADSRVRSIPSGRSPARSIALVCSSFPASPASACRTYPSTIWSMAAFIPSAPVASLSRASRALPCS